MKQLITAAALLMAAVSTRAVDLANGERLNQRCAPCHALAGQGVPGATSPRLAGLPAWYLTKAIKDYIKGARANPAMTEIAGLKQMSDEDIADLSAWLSRQPIGKDPAYDIRVTRGDAQKGKAKFEADCKTCHARDGRGKKKKDAPPLAGQHPDYLFASMRAFFHKDRYHDNDPIDDTFDDISDAQAWNILAWMAILDGRGQQPGFRFKPAPIPTKPAERGAFLFRSVQQTVISTFAAKGTSPREAIDAMLAEAKKLGVPKLPPPPVWDKEAPLVTALNFCEPRHIDKLLKAAPILANYDPCRITLIRDAGKGLRLMTVNLDMLIDGEQLPPAAQRIAILINEDMLAILRAGRHAHAAKTELSRKQGVIQERAHGEL